MRIKQGSTIIQYSIILGIIACVVTAGYFTIGTTVSNIMGGYNNSYKALSDNAKTNLDSNQKALTKPSSNTVGSTNTANTIENTNTSFNENKPTSFNINDQNITTPPAIITEISEFTATSGSNGNDFVRITKENSSINEIKGTHKDTETPVDLKSGHNKRSIDVSDISSAKTTKATVSPTEISERLKAVKTKVSETTP